MTDPLDKELETIVKPGMYGEEREQALSALKQIIGRARIEELQIVHDNWQRTHQSEKVQDRVDARLAELESEIES